ncbi:Uncharacterised protein [Mycobacteroides abscessus subsp. abscessus]|nr:Uncharacterised protein [Mycobacteroides abscessus subsp. abscessus]SHU48955.1 Uncharacterised protein [Mycobacteroides abscessus subsp. abscessus]SIA44140.1 Uncharacterised protein [Mycobacteroides abscessus subsp. abscessus]SIG16442.1 Uncharacterised protein [Mycobacteroides abscessus subsp. abscessus]SIH18456.1 Uncharacterised protein [Mycobacteroides abscessus subsp. abscessus]
MPKVAGIPATPRRDFFTCVTRLEKEFETEPELRRLLDDCVAGMQAMLDMLDARPQGCCGSEVAWENAARHEERRPSLT